MQILENLIKEGHIGLDEALILLETEKETVYVPYVYPNVLTPWDYAPTYINEPYKITCNTVISDGSELRTFTN